ncbi:AAA family ATPase [Bifidobacterium sp. ESL0763]|uniref:ATP-dependent nuclease n=1 Tax=Bifidobacterium sp. ESL0763 TaxID=2983227 RepID=UPI0023F98BA3|nr:AAA family ATPase [Bifidobacterium sp. ESL0763]MDF7663554.1 AAA family ATPase [Bifidobacterium sp. ESL0763]
MKLEKMIIKGFRSFGEEQELTFNKNTVFVGTNGTGKTTALLALCKIFSKDAKERTIEQEDFHLNIGEDYATEQELNLFIEVTFNLGKDVISAGPTFFRGLTVEQPNGDLILRIRLESKWANDGSIGGAIDTEVYVVTSEGKSHVSRQWLNAIRVIYVPASRNPAQALNRVSGGILSNLIRAIDWEKGDQRKLIEQQIEDLDNSFSSVNDVEDLSGQINRQWRELDNDSRHSTVKLHFINNDFEHIVRRPFVAFSEDGFTREYKTDDLSDGQKSLFYFSLIKALFGIETVIRKTIQEQFTPVKSVKKVQIPVHNVLLVEEPENHISPQLLGKLVEILVTLTNDDSCQLIFSSQSPAIIKRIEPKDIRYFKLSKESNTLCKPLTLPDNESEAYKYIKNAIQAYPELYFSKLVILGEGESEQIILPKVLNPEIKSDLTMDVRSISIVPLGGRFVHHFWKLLRGLGIPYITLLDFDQERYGGDWGRIRYAINELKSFGFNVESFYDFDGSKFDNEKLKQMTSRPLDLNQLTYWRNQLESFSIFYSAPLDIDFLMLEQYPEIYKSIADEFSDKLNLKSSDEAVRLVLHEHGKDGTSYSPQEKELMPLYTYLFLNKGKPITHFMAIQKLGKNDLAKEPEIFQRMFNKINELLGE